MSGKNGYPYREFFDAVRAEYNRTSFELERGTYKKMLEEGRITPEYYTEVVSDIAEMLEIEWAAGD